MKLHNKVYDVMKWVCLVVSPAVSTLIVTLDSLWMWGIPVDAIVGTISAITTFCGVILGISNIAYYKKEGGSSVEQ